MNDNSATLTDTLFHAILKLRSLKPFFCPREFLFLSPAGFFLVVSMRSEYINYGDLQHLFAVLMPENALALRVALETGLRIGDVLAIRTEQLRTQRFTVREQKTGKSKRIYLSKPLWDALRRSAGRYYVFEGRNDPKKHRTRQAVFADLKRAARAFRLPQNVSIHSIRKLYAVTLLDETGDMELVQRALNHDRITTTLIYALSDRLDLLQPKKRNGKPPRPK